MIHQAFNSADGLYNVVGYYTAEGFPTPNIHHSAELILIVSGSAWINIEGKLYEVDEGTAALVLPDQVHSFGLSDGSECFVQVFSSACAPGFFHILGSKTIATPVIKLNSATFDYWRLCCSDGLTCGGAMYTQIESEELSESEMLRLRSALYAVLSEFLSGGLSERDVTQTELYGRVMVYILDHCRERLSLKDVAAHFGYEEHYFSRLLKKMSVLNFRQIVNRCRIDIALELLESSNMEISTVALECGYESLRTFNRIFLEVEGITPRKYRKMHHINNADAQ